MNRRHAGFVTRCNRHGKQHLVLNQRQQRLFAQCLDRVGPIIFQCLVRPCSTRRYQCKMLLIFVKWQRCKTTLAYKMQFADTRLPKWLATRIVLTMHYPSQRSAIVCQDIGQTLQHMHRDVPGQTPSFARKFKAIDANIAELLHTQSRHKPRMILFFSFPVKTSISPAIP